jgi:DNA-binding NtrC family response regulator
MAEKQRILIVDDDYNIAELISKNVLKRKLSETGKKLSGYFPNFSPT